MIAKWGIDDDPKITCENLLTQYSRDQVYAGICAYFWLWGKSREEIFATAYKKYISGASDTRIKSCFDESEASGGILPLPVASWFIHLSPEMRQAAVEAVPFD